MDVRHGLTEWLRSCPHGDRFTSHRTRDDEVRLPHPRQHGGERMQRVLPLQAITLVAVCLLVGCSESGTRGPTAPDPPAPLAAALAPAADTVQVLFTVEIQTGQTVHFTIEVTGGDPDTEPSWTCASADTTVASAAQTASGCSATGTGVGTTTITATVTRGTATATAAVGLRVMQPPLFGALAPAADTVRTGQTAQFTLEITGGDSNAEPAWTCASADTLVASTAATSFGCSTTGTGTGATTISATVTRGMATFSASASPPGSGYERHVRLLGRQRERRPHLYGSKGQGRRIETFRLQGQPGWHRADLRVAGTREVERQRR